MSQRKIMIKRISVLALVLLVGFAGGWVTNLLLLAEDTKQGYVSTITSGLKNDFEIIKLLEGQGVFTTRVKGQFDEKFSQAALLLMITQPNYRELTAIPTQEICELIEYHDSYGITVDDTIDSNVNTYLKSISPIIKQEMTNLQRFTGGEGCQISGSGPKECRYRDAARCKNET